jgi:hypothetical protein
MRTRKRQSSKMREKASSQKKRQKNAFGVFGVKAWRASTSHAIA